MNNAQILPDKAFKGIKANLKYVDLIEDERVVSLQAKWNGYVFDVYADCYIPYKFEIEYCSYREGDKWTAFSLNKEQQAYFNAILEGKYIEYKDALAEERQKELEARWEYLEESQYETCML